MEPIVKPLSRFRRQIFFFSLFASFVIALPAFIFYATGYRYDFFADSPTITATGGLYVITSVADASIYVNEAPARNPRVFRSAAYIQGLEAGMHRVHVQFPGTETWVKELVVLPHIVTEVESFNLPSIPHIRPVTPYLTATGTPVVVLSSTGTLPFLFATTSAPYVATTSRATSTLATNREYERLSELFIEQASTTALRAKIKQGQEKAEEFGFATATVALADATLATTTIRQNNLMLYEQGDDVYAKTLGDGRDIPAYFCAVTESATAKVRAELQAQAEQGSSTLGSLGSAIEFAPGDLPRVCRTDIQINRHSQEILGFTFFPGSDNLVLLHLTDGVYVSEIDDRAWQNTQKLYPGRDIEMIIDGGRIYVKDGGNIVEVYTTVATP